MKNPDIPLNAFDPTVTTAVIRAPTTRAVPIMLALSAMVWATDEIMVVMALRMFVRASESEGAVVIRG